MSKEQRNKLAQDQTSPLWWFSWFWTEEIVERIVSSYQTNLYMQKIQYRETCSASSTVLSMASAMGCRLESIDRTSAWKNG
mmetsp:Transcript_5830/g.11555  ORF Transcript_5830/g.11555 Transcript_5830/m.11555 type:complete len:81 (+) Transcript_5830:263-505(+)